VLTRKYGPITKWPKELVAKYREKTGEKLGRRYPASKVAESVMEAFPLLRRIGEVVDGRERGWAELMCVESRAVLSTMIGLMDQRVPSLAVHDSLIVPLSSWHETMINLAHWYQRFANAWPVLMLHFPEGHEMPTFKQNQITIRSGCTTLSNDAEVELHSDDDPNNPLNF
jgi:hypothetical protein